ncbi:MAG TPA: diguanylate cyclase [Ktedonobacteraceae bacterium]|nr:diguanylate cyclase [Ktedonobacteraceae bacterium]
MDSTNAQRAASSTLSMWEPATILRRTRHLLLALPIGRRLALALLIPMLAVLLSLGSIGLQSYQLLSNVSTFSQHLLHASTSLTGAIATLQQTHTNLLGTLSDASKPQTTPETLREDRTTTLYFVASYDTTLKAYLRQDVLARYPGLAALLRASGHSSQLTEQQVRASEALRTWQAYQSALMQVLNAVSDGKLSEASSLEVQRVEPMYASAMTTLLILIQFTENLVPAIHDATIYEEGQVLLSMGLSALGLFIDMGVVVWLISRTVVRRLYRFRAVVQQIEQGEFSTRLTVDGRDEIALVSRAVNTTLDTIVGLLEETRRQRDELAKGEELKRLHEQLQREHEALNAANTRLAALATTDPLTELPNHRALQALLEQECERARRFGHPLSLLFFDGDRFKQTNDTYGHAVGDLVLRELGERARSVLRAGDAVGRFGGEEFLVLLPETDVQEAKIVAERLRAAVAALPLAAREVNGGIAVTVSVGVAGYPGDGRTADELREQADQAMYWAKRLGRNQVRTAAEAVRANLNAALKAATAKELQRPELQSLDGRDLEQQVRVEQLGLIYSLMGVLDWREPGMSAHAHEVSDLVAGMARALQFDQERLLRAATAAFLHDIGKIALPDRLLQQPREHFSEPEWRLLHQHAELGATIVEASPWLSDLAPAIRHHHERWDGTGHPNGLTGEAIPLEARMIAVAEAYHAMISDQPYQASRSPQEALAELERRAGSQFDPALIPLFRQMLASRQEEASSLWQLDLPDSLLHV